MSTSRSPLPPWFVVVPVLPAVALALSSALPSGWARALVVLAAALVAGYLGGLLIRARRSAQQAEEQRALDELDPFGDR